MFNFLKRHKPQDEIPAPEQQLSARELALRVFSKIEGLDDAENQHKEIIIIDEVDKMQMQHQEDLLTMMERGEFTSTKVRNTRTVKANIVIFATSNSTDRLSKPLLSRFNVFEIPEYTYEEFEAISVRIIKKLPHNTIMQIASFVWKTGSRDIRDVVKIAKLCNTTDTEEDVHRLISIHQKYHR